MNWSIPEPFYYHNKGGRTQNTWEKEKSTHILETEWEDIGRWVKYVHKDDEIESDRIFFFSKKDEIAMV